MKKQQGIVVPKSNFFQKKDLIGISLCMKTSYADVGTLTFQSFQLFVAWAWI